MLVWSTGKESAFANEAIDFKKGPLFKRSKLCCKLNLNASLEFDFRAFFGSAIAHRKSGPKFEKWGIYLLFFNFLELNATGLCRFVSASHRFCQKQLECIAIIAIFVTIM